MDMLLLAAAVVVGVSGFCAVLGLSESLWGTSRLVRARTIEPSEAPAPVPVSGQALARRRAWQRWRAETDSWRGKSEQDLVRADWPIRLREYVILRIGLAVAVSVLVLVLSGVLSIHGLFGALLVVVGAIIGYWLPRHYVRGRAANRLKKI